MTPLPYSIHLECPKRPRAAHLVHILYKKSMPPRGLNYKAIIALAVVVFLLFYYLSTTDNFFNDFVNSNTEKSHIGAKRTGTFKTAGTDGSCPLPLLDPWDKAVLKYVNPQANPMAGCKVTYEPRTYLTLTGHLWVKKTRNESLANDTCFYRCKHSVSDKELYTSNWTIIDKQNGSQPNCDLMEVKCESQDTGTQTYKFEHLQIVEKPPNPKKAKIGSFDVHMIIIDSVSMSHFLRTLPQTANYIQNEMGAVLFPHLNKIADGSRFNSYGILIGEQLEVVTFNDQGQTKLGKHGDQICKEPVDNRTLFSDFKREGYKTLHFEDSANTIFVYPDCNGFDKNEIDHNMRPFVLPFNGPKKYKDKEMFDNLVKYQCKEPHDYVLQSLSQFVKAYKSEPKFSLSWMVYLSHDDMDTMFHVDEQFRNWFDQHRKELSNSFVFFMGDHGQKITKFGRTPIGQIEKKNPFFSIILPEKLRKNKELVEQLRINSKQLITQYDMHASLRDILEQSYSWSEKTTFVNLPPYESPNKKKPLLGSSIFRSLKQPRNCDNLSFHSCIACLVNDTDLLERVAQLVVDQMNKALNESAEHAEKCVQLTVDKEGIKKLNMQVFDPDENGRQVIRAELKVLPSGGFYDTFAEKTGDKIKLMVDKFPRLDRYEEQTKCSSPSYLKNYCYCKDLLKKKS
ncbi:hypothetical protein M3Y97_00940200 [Aphelenchoides bicaudatus]|nr:hypothetical protein M3Y97_00940200 [Aphelenchoides bicaudatus]